MSGLGLIILTVKMPLSSNSFPTDGHGWSELLPLRKPAPALVGSRRVPWVVIGAGLTGLSAARRLALRHPDQPVLLLDARRIGQGASGRNSGFAVAVSHFGGRYDPDQRLNYERVNRINQAGLAMLSARISEGKMDCQWRNAGFYLGAVDQFAVQEAKDYSGSLQALDIAHSVLERDELSELLGSSLYKSAIHLPTGAMVQPAALVRGLAKALPANVELFEDTPVLEISGGGTIGLITPQGRIDADKVLMATNYEAPKLGFLKRRIIGSTLSGSFTRVLTSSEKASLGSLPDWGLISLHGGGATVRLTVDGRICLRNTAEYRGGALLTDSQSASRQLIHRAAFENRFPKLAHVPFEYFWSGVEGISGNNTNFFGALDPGIYYAGGYNGSGVSRGTAFGCALADFACGHDTSLVRNCQGSAPAQWLPPRPVLDIGAFFKVRSRFKDVGQDR